MDDRTTMVRYACLETLQSVLNSISTAWAPVRAKGWHEFPTPGGHGEDVDAWSTAQALEMMGLSFTCLREHAESLAGATTANVKAAMVDGLPLLLNAMSVGEHASRLTRPAPTAASGVVTWDTMGTVWCLRAVGEVVSTSASLELEVPVESVSRGVESLLQGLFDSQGRRGGWSAYGGGGTSTYATAMVVWAVAEVYKVFEPAMHLRPHKVHGTHLAIEWLLSNRVMGEGLPFFEMGRASTISRTALAQIAIAARRAMMTAERVRDADVFSMSAWILKAQAASGGWRDYAEESDRLETEVTALAVIGLLRGGVSPRNPAVEAAVKVLLRSRITDELTTGWGLYVEPQAGDLARIWTTWCAVLALCEFVTQSQHGSRDLGSFEIRRVPKLVTVVEGETRSVRVRLDVRGAEQMWLFPESHVGDRVASLEPTEPSRITPNEEWVSIKIKGSNAGSSRWCIELCDVVGGEKRELVARVVCLGGVGRSFVRAVSDPQMAIAGIAVAAGIYGIVRSGAAGSGAAIAVATIGVLAVIVLFIFALVKQMFGD